MLTPSPIDVVALDDHVAEIDADAQFDALVVRRHRCSRSAIASLHLDRAAHRIDDAGKLHQQAVAGGLDDAAVVLGDLRIDELAHACALRRSSVPSSSAPISREYPATSAARIAARRRVWLMSPRPPPGAGPTGTARGARGCGRQIAGRPRVMARSRATIARASRAAPYGHSTRRESGMAGLAGIVLNGQEQLLHAASSNRRSEEMSAAPIAQVRMPDTARAGSARARSRHARSRARVGPPSILRRPLQIPAAGKARVERQRTVDQPDHGADVLAEIASTKAALAGRPGRLRRLERLPSKIAGPAADCLRISRSSSLRNEPRWQQTAARTVRARNAGSLAIACSSSPSASRTSLRPLSK